MAAPVYASDTFTQFASGTTPWTVNKPSGVVAGDLLVAIALTGTAGTLSATGWSTETVVNNTHILTRVADGTEGATFSFNWNVGHSGNIFVIRVTGAAASGALEATSGARPFGTSVTIPSLTTLGADRLLIAFLGVENSGVLRTWTPPGGWTSQHANANTGWQGATYSEAFATAAATGTQTFSASGSSVQLDGLMLAIAPAGAATQSITGAGAIASAEAFGTPVITPGAVTVTPTAIASVAAFGTASVSQPGGPQTVGPSAIASGETFGTATITPGVVTVSPSAIASAETFGAPTVSGGASVLAITGAGGIASGETFGTRVSVQLGPAPVSVTVGAGPGGGLDFHVTGLWYPGASSVPYYGRIADPQDGEVVIALNDSRTASVTVSLFDPIVKDLHRHTYARCLRVYYHDQLVFWGPCKLIDIDMAAGTAKLNAVDPTLRLIRHYLRRGDLNGNLNASNDDRYPVTIDATGLGLLRDAAKNILEQTARGVPDLGIADGVNYFPDSPDDQMGVARGDEVWDAMTQLCASLGPDMEFEPTEDLPGYYCLLNTWRSQGSDKSDRVQLHWGTGRDNLVNLTTQEGAKYTTHVHVLSRDLRYRFTEANLATSADTGPYVDWDATDYDAHGIPEPAVERVLRAYGDDILNAYSVPLLTCSIELPAEDDSSYLYLQDYRVGDTIGVAGRAGQVDLTEDKWRITSVALRQDGESGGVKPELKLVPSRLTVFGDTSEEG